MKSPSAKIRLADKDAINTHEPRSFGGMGGIEGGRRFNPDDEFESAVNRQLGDAMRADKSLRYEMWSALANQDWTHISGDTAGYSFRAAGDLIAAICNDGTDYMDYYCTGDYATVSERIASALAKEGWSPDDEEDE